MRVLTPDHIVRRLLAVGLCAGLILAFSTAPVRADTADDLAKQADKALRQAERLMFSGKAADAQAKLTEVAGLLEKIEAQDPAHKKFPSLRKKYEKLTKDVARRLPKDEPQKEPPDAGDRADKKQPAKLPYAVREQLKDIAKVRRTIDNDYRWIEKSKTMELSKPLEDYYAEIERNAGEMKQMLKKTRQAAAQKGVTDHPDLDEMQTYLDAAPKRLAKIKADMIEFQREQAAKEAAEKAAREQEAAATKVDVKRATEDWRALATVCKEYQDKFVSESAVKAQGTALKKQWDDWKKRFEPARDRFRQRYGKTIPEVSETFEGMSKPDGITMDAWLAANIAYNTDPADCERRIADWAARWADQALRLSANIKPDNKEKLELKVTRAEDAAAYYKLARLWNPDGQFDEKIRQAESAVKEALPLWKDVLKELKWPGHNKDFAGPGNPEELAAAALEFLRQNPTWSKPEYADEHVPYAACVEGKGWDVSKRAPLTHEPTQYSVNVLVAFTGQANPQLAYVYHMVFYTAEAGGVKAGLPFRYANSRQYACFRMLKENVPAAK